MQPKNLKTTTNNKIKLKIITLLKVKDLTPTIMVKLQLVIPNPVNNKITINKRVPRIALLGMDIDFMYFKQSF